MQQLLCAIREQLPVGAPEADLCQKICIGCPKKLMSYLEQEVNDWQRALDDGETPKLGDIRQLARAARKIHAVIEKNGLLMPQRSPVSRTLE
ncbi:hypothetical Protein YC6258_00132 [Gynuella sunshinyii YC6258]|uniref:Uncharacterized protein n=2 Tax=Gynuella sunshinyii TaxID=1445505 RepID=A0A0C5VCH3_9GAMM|nr:hypothetical Protein YC6258_00132 [Gynuella sunshinyii YC6258]